MIELIVVVGILGLLIAIVLPAGNAIIQQTRGKATNSTMEVLSGAIGSYSDDAPLQNQVHVTQTGIRYCYRDYFGPKLPPDYFVWPPEKYEIWTDNDGDEQVDLPGELQNDQVNPNDEGFGRFNPARISNLFAGGNLVDRGDIPQVSSVNGIQRRIGGSWVPEPCPTPADKDYRSIESLYFYISQLSPKGQVQLSHLRADVVKNQDECGGAACPDMAIVGLQSGASEPKPAPTDWSTNPNVKRVDLFEVNDAWGHPMRYQVRRTGLTAFEWELRSAGPDGQFANMFTPAEQSDDVILHGQ